MATKTKGIRGRTTSQKVADTPFEASQNKEFYTQEPPYSEVQRQYRKFLLQRMTEARNRREDSQVFFNNMTYTQNYRSNMLAANSYTPPRANAEDTQVVTGTTREKVLTIVSAVLQFDFLTKFRAFDQNNFEDEATGEVFTDIVRRSNKVELWDDKKLAAFYEMASQGDVYIQDQYIEETLSDRKRVALGKVTEEMMRQETLEKPENRVVSFTGYRRSMIPGTQVYKGSMTTLSLRDQPYIFTREVKSYDYTKSIYGDLPWWKYVPRKLVELENNDDPYNANWRLETVTDDNCEIIIYRDRFNKEYNIIINGVMMLPAGFGLPWSHDEYDIVQGGLEPISAFFSEHKSIPSKTKLDQEILDEMYRLAVLKTQKSFMPPIANYSNNILSRSMFLPGKVNNSLSKGEIEVLGGDPSQYSMKPSEFEMIQMIKKFIDEKSLDPVIQGQGQGGTQTATEINTLTQQAKQKLGVIIFGFMKLQQDLDTLRLYNELDNCSKEMGTKANEAKTAIEKKYKSFMIAADLGERGAGMKHIQFTNTHSRPDQLYDLEQGITRDNSGKPIAVNPPKVPIRIMQISPQRLRSIKYSWFSEIETKEKEESLTSRIGFEDRLLAAMKLFGQPSINMKYVQEAWATKNKLDASMFFNQTPPPQPFQVQPGQPQSGAPEESNLNKQSRPYGSGAGPAEAMRQQGLGK